MDAFDLGQIAEQTGLNIRLLRYVLEHSILPGSQQHSRGHRVTRSFTAFEAFSIACAAAMLRAGIRRSLVAQVMIAVSAYTKVSRRMDDVPLFRAYASTGPAYLEIGDDTAVQVRTEQPHRPYESGWICLPYTGAAGVAPDPLVMHIVRISAIRDLIKDGSAA